MKIGFIGLGNVGAKLAVSLLRNGFDLTVRDLNDAIVRSFVDQGAASAASPKEMTENVDLW
jgi:3-hydroxyisobutyrate dehydrogenase